MVGTQRIPWFADDLSVFNFGRHFQLSSHHPGISSKFVDNPHLNFPTTSNPYWEWINFGRKTSMAHLTPQTAGNGSLASCAARLGEMLRDESYFDLNMVPYRLPAFPLSCGGKWHVLPDNLPRIVVAVSANGDTQWILPMNMERVKCFHDSEVPPFFGKNHADQM